MGSNRTCEAVADFPLVWGAAGLRHLSPVPLALGWSGYLFPWRCFFSRRTRLAWLSLKQQGAGFSRRSCKGVAARGGAFTLKLEGVCGVKEKSLAEELLQFDSGKSEPASLELDGSLPVGINKSKPRLMKLIICPCVCKIKKSKPKPEFGWIFQGNGILGILWSSVLDCKVFLQNNYIRSKGKKSRFALGEKPVQGLEAAYSRWALSLATAASLLPKYLALIEPEAESLRENFQPKWLK